MPSLVLCLDETEDGIFAEIDFQWFLKLKF